LPGSLAGTRAVGPYAGWLRGAILAFKYDDEPDRAAHLAGMLAASAADLGSDCLVVPTPLHPSRHAERGYNQSALLAREMARIGGWASEEPALVRTRATAQQAKLGGSERRANVAGAFALAPGFDHCRVQGRRVVLVDDVFTTGATAEACALVLLAAGAAEVFAAALAREA
jgi:ComF family protein